MTLQIISPSEVVSRIDRPFAPLPIGMIGDVSVSVFRALGQIQWHRHIDEDEIFWVHEGNLKIETQLGNFALRTGEAILIPKSVAHHSGADEPTVVLLLRHQVLVERKNGHRKNLATGEEPRLVKQRFADLLPEAAPPYESVTVTKMEAHLLTVSAAKGFSDAQHTGTGGSLLYALYGAVNVEVATGGVHLAQGQLTILPKETSYTLQAERGALLVKYE